jgi:hypothetical protein
MNYSGLRSYSAAAHMPGTSNNHEPWAASEGIVTAVQGQRYLDFAENNEGVVRSRRIGVECWLVSLS